MAAVRSIRGRSHGVSVSLQDPVANGETLQVAVCHTFSDVSSGVTSEMVTYLPPIELLILIILGAVESAMLSS
jgi:hypothetical protein